MANDPDSAHQWGAFTLGVSASTPLDIANAYATLAGDGMYCAPTPIQQITTQDGEKIDVGQPELHPGDQHGRGPRGARRGPLPGRRPGPARQLRAARPRRDARGVVGHPVFGKTGTTDDDKTAALVVGTQSLVVAGYLVNPDWAEPPRPDVARHREPGGVGTRWPTT